MPNDKSQFNKCKRKWKRDLLITGPQKVCRAPPRATQKAQGRAQTKRDRIWGTCFYRDLWVECFRVLRLRPDWPIQTKRVGFWQVPQGSYLRIHKGKVLGGRGDTRTIGGAKAGTCLWLCGLLSRACTCMRGQCQFKVPPDHLAKQSGR